MVVVLLVTHPPGVRVYIVPEVPDALGGVDVERGVQRLGVEDLGPLARGLVVVPVEVGVVSPDALRIRHARCLPPGYCASQYHMTGIPGLQTLRMARSR